MDILKPKKFIKLLFRLIPYYILERTVIKFSCFEFIKETKDTQTPISFKMWYDQIIQNKNNGPYWPVHPTSLVSGWRNVYCGIDTSPGYSFGNYISAHEGQIHIGDYTQIAPNVGIFSQNHLLTDSRKFVVKNVFIGKYCWIGMGAIILPGVNLGDFTIVAAGSIVTKSFEDGYCVIGGNPAKPIKYLDRTECLPFRNNFEYNGYIKKQDFAHYSKNNLNI